ncbi:MAG: hypothetical protein ACP5HS_00145 [Anaerolineae bacterium]
MPESTSTQQEPARSQQEDRNPVPNEDLVRKVADRVYAMLLHDLAIERERQRPSARVMGGKGGWW